MRWEFAAGVFVVIAATGVHAEDLTYRGWAGAADYNGGQFVACHLDSPPAVSEPHDQIRIAASSSSQYVIQFAAYFGNPQPAPGQTANVGLAVANGENVYSEAWSGAAYGYRASVLSTGQAADGRPFARMLLGINADDAVNAHLKDARFLKVFWQVPVQNFPDLNFSSIDLRHRSSSDANAALDANDTFGAIGTVIACARSHAAVANAPGWSSAPSGSNLPGGANAPGGAKAPASPGGAGNNAPAPGHVCATPNVAGTARIAFGLMYISPQILNALRVQQNDLADAFTLRDIADGPLDGRKQSCSGTINLVKEWFDAKGQAADPGQLGWAERGALVLMAAAFAAHPDGLPLTYTVDASNSERITVSVQNPITLASWTMPCYQCGGW